MSRRNNAPGRRRYSQEDDRPRGLGSHWRADGAPKTVFRSRQDALRASGGRQLESGVALEVYRCDFCSYWHLTSAVGRER
ncbi:MAG: hypothetical protein ACLQRH_06520 [Acidimicrobiales bacterium]